MSAEPKADQTRWRERSSYAKSADTRQSILQAAIEAFGAAGFDSVTTRQIAAAANVNQPSIAYYFGNKEGLYQACIETIVDHYADYTAHAGQHALDALEQGTNGDEAREVLKTLMGALADLMLGSPALAQSAGLVEREFRERGTGYTYLYENFWKPGVDMVSALLANAKHKSRPNQTERAEAVMLISGLIAFASGQTLTREIMGWGKMGEAEASLVRKTINNQIDAITA